MAERRWCVNCRHGAITISPSVGGFTSGVFCHNEVRAKQMDMESNGDMHAVEEFEHNSYVYMFRGECVDEDFDCPAFGSRRDVDKPVQVDDFKQELDTLEKEALAGMATNKVLAEVMFKMVVGMEQCGKQQWTPYGSCSTCIYDQICQTVYNISVKELPYEENNH
ncbi:MAG: hypothetical protein ACWGQW_00565 [bacterium]